MAHKKTKLKNKIWSLALCASMILSCLPVSAFAESQDGTCEHHHEHTAECGYVVAVEGQLCTHEHTDDCYSIVKCVHEHDENCSENGESCTHVCSEESGCITVKHNCHHTHDENCDYGEGVPVSDCIHECGEECVEGCIHEHDDTCGYAEEVEATPCNHVCSIEGGCYEPICSHVVEGQHDDTCGYVAAVEGSLCQYECEEDHGEEEATESTDNTIGSNLLGGVNSSTGSSTTDTGTTGTTESGAGETDSTAGTAYGQDTGTYQKPDGLGTAEKPYEIANAGNLYWFAEQANASVETDSKGNSVYTACAVLTADITVNPGTFAENGTYTPAGTESAKVWSPICNGKSYIAYTGTFDGQGHSISGLYYYGRMYDERGLFGYIGAGGTVKNVFIANSYFNDNNNAGTIAAVNSGTVENCGVLDGVYLKGGTEIAAVGGVVGVNNSTGTVKNCFSAAKVSNAYSVGGVVGTNCGTVTNCYFLSSGELSGIGEDNTSDNTTTAVTNFSTGEVTYQLNGDQSAIVWYQTLGADGDKYPVLDTTHGRVYRYGMTYSNSSTCPHDEHENGFCTVCGEDYQEPSRDSNGTYLIENAGNLYWFAKHVNDGSVKANAKLTKNITVNASVLTDGKLSADTSALKQWTPIGNGTNAYQGTFDGQNYSISGLYYSGSSSSSSASGTTGLFGRIGDGAKIQNVGLIDSCFQVSGGAVYLGGIVGYAYANATAGSITISNCSSTALLVATGSDAYVGGMVGYGYSYEGKVTIENCSNTGDLTATSTSASYSYAYVGGMAGYVYSAEGKVTIENCSNTGDLTATSTSTSDSTAYVGGVAGYVDASNGSVTVQNCSNTGKITATSTASYSYAYCGGVAGYVDVSNGSVTIQNCFNTGDLTATFTDGEFYCGGVVGCVYAYADATGQGTVTLSNCYYTAANAYGDKYAEDGATVTTDRVDKKTVEQFKSGEVAYLLNDGKTGDDVVWKQTLGTDKTPNFTSTQIVYTSTNCVNTTFYTNDSTKEPGSHDYNSNGFCTACDGYETPAQDDSDYYLIDNAGKLYWFSQYVVSSANNTKANAKLTADITVNSGTFAADGTYTHGEGEAAGTTPRQWILIGKGTADIYAYNCTFDGQGHTISGLYFNNTNTDSDHIGLFGSVGTNGKVQNVTVKDTYFKGRLYVGGIVGYNKGTVTNCVSSGTIIGTNDVGGIVGFNFGGKLTGCTNSGSVSGANSVGGVVGQNNAGTITSCHNSGAVSGEERVSGIVGCNSGGTIAGTADKYTTNSGTVIGKSYVGGIVGENENASSGTVIGTIRYCENSAGGTVTGTDGVTVQFTGGIVGYNDGGTVENCQNKAAVTGDAYVGGIVGSNGSSGEVSHCKNSGAVSGSGKNIGGIAGNNNGGTLQNCENSAKVMCTGDDDTCGNIGGIVGYNSGATTNVGTITSCKNTGDVSSIACVGGIVGNWMSNGKVTLCENSGAISGWSGIGGIVGYVYDADSTISDCVNSGTVTGTYFTYEEMTLPSQCIGGIVGMGGSVLRCINVGTVTGGQNVGSIVGEKEYGSVENSYYLSATETADGGKTAAQFASGEVAYLLNDGKTGDDVVWKQTVGSDDYPNFTGLTVYYDAGHDPNYYNKDSDKIASVTITWTDMSFSYNKGTWNTDIMRWEGGGWKADAGCGTVKVTNTGSLDVTAQFGVTFTDETLGISVGFTENGTALTDNKLTVAKGAEETVTVKLTGDEPSEYIEMATTIGQITLTLSTE